MPPAQSGVIKGIERRRPTMSRIFTLAAVLAFLQLAPTTATAQYYATAPSCAVISLGAGDVHWECIYGSIEQCRTTILAGQSRIL
jgi:hypothetical protein